MQPQKLIAAFFSAALLCTTSIALADKGGNHDKHGGSPGQSGSAPGQSQSSNSQHGPSSNQGPRQSPGFTLGSSLMDKSNGMEASVQGSSSDSVSLKLANGSTQTFAITSPALTALKSHGTKSEKLIFFTNNGTTITAVAAPGESTNMRVTGQNGNVFMLQGNDGQSRLIALDNGTIARLHVKTGSNLKIITKSATSGKVVALDMMKAQGSGKTKTVSRLKLDTHGGIARQVAANGKCGPTSSRNGNPAFANQMAKDAANDASGHNPPGLPHECVNPAGHTRGFCKSESGSGICGGNGAGSSESEVALAAGGKPCAPGKSRNGNPAFANQAAKDAANDASGHNPPGLPHECVNPAGHTRGFCKSQSSEALCGGNGAVSSETEVGSVAGGKPCAPGTKSSRTGNPAFANQMAKDERNDISGHNPPGLPHECVNPAGHTRGFCKSKSSESGALCGSAIASSGSNVAVTPGVANAPSVPTTPAVPSRFTPGLFNNAGATRGPGAPMSFIPGPGGQFATSPRGAAVGAPTRVLGAATAPGAAHRRVAMLPARVLPVAITPVGKRRCVWYKTGVLAASTGGMRIVGTSAIGGKPKLHKKCR